MANLTTLVSSAVLRSAKGSALSHQELDDNIARAQSNMAVVNSNTTLVNSELLTRAWATFQGCNGAILRSFNVASITRVGTGNYTAILSASMPTSLYNVLATPRALSGGVPLFCFESGSAATHTSTGFGLFACTYTGSLTDAPVVNLTVFG